MTQYSLPQDGSTGDGGVYDSVVAAKEIKRPYYVRDNPQRYGLEVIDIFFSGTILTATITAGEAMVGSRSLIEDTEQLIDLTAAPENLWCLVLIDNAEGVDDIHFITSDDTMHLTDLNGIITPVLAGDVTYRLCNITPLNSSILTRDDCFITQYMHTIDAPKRNVSDLVIHYSNIIAEPLVIYCGNIRPNMFTVSGLLCVPNTEANQSLAPNITLTFNNLGANFVQHFRIDGVDVTIPGSPITVALSIAGLGSQQGEFTHLLYEVIFNVHNNYLLITGELTEHMLPNDNVGAHPSGINTVSYTLSGMIYMDSSDWSISNISNVLSVGNLIGHNSVLEVTYR